MTVVPIVNPANVIDTNVARTRAGMSSETSAIAFGITPLRNTPVTKRSTTNSVTVLANGATSVSAPNAVRHVNSVTRRP